MTWVIYNPRLQNYLVMNLKSLPLSQKLLFCHLNLQIKKKIFLSRLYVGTLLWRWYWKTINHHRHHWLKIFYHCGLDEGQSSTGKRFLFVAFGHLDSRFAAWWCNRTLLNCAQVMINGLEIKLTIFLIWKGNT